MKRYILSDEISIKVDKDKKRTFPCIDGKNVKNREAFFPNKDMWDNFYEPEPNFDYMDVGFVGDLEEDPWIINDLHTWTGRKPRNCFTYIISPKLKTLLESFNLAPSRFYPGKVLFEEKFHEYYVWHILRSPYLEFINFDQSTFTEWHLVRTRHKIGKNVYHAKNFDDLQELDKKLFKQRYDWGFENAVMNPSFKENDCCWFPKLGYVISERLKNAIEEAGITGVKIEEQTEVQFEYA